MRKTDSLVLEITVDDKGSPVVKNFKKNLSDVSKSTVKNTNDMQTGFKSLWKQMALGQMAFVGVQQGLQSILGTLRGSVKAFLEQEKADKMLEASMKNLGSFSQTAFEGMKKFASEIQKVTVIGDETTEQIMALGMNMGVSADHIKEATKQAIGLSKAYKFDLNTSMRMVALARQGDFNLLKRYIPELRKTNDLTKLQAIYTKKAADGFKLAQAETETYAGKIQQLKNAWGDFQEKIGKVIVDLVVKMLEWKEVILSVAVALASMKLSSVINGLGGMSKLIPDLVSKMKLLSTTANLTKLAFGGLVAGLVILGKKIIDLTNDINKAHDEGIRAIQGLSDTTHRAHLSVREYKKSLGISDSEWKKLLQNYKHIEDPLLRQQKLIQDIKKGKYGDELKKQAEKATIAHKKLNKVIQKTEKSQDKVTKSKNDMIKKIKEATEEALNEYDALKEGNQIYAENQKAIDEMSETIDGIPVDKLIELENIENEINAEGDELLRQAEEWKKSTENSTSVLEKYSKTLNKAGEYMQQGADVLAKTGILSEEAAEGLYQAGEGAMEAASGLSKLASGDIIGGIMDLVSGIWDLVAGIGKLFGGDGVQEAIDRENSWMNMNEELNDSLHDLAEEVGDTHLATSMMLDEIMDKSEITVDNFDQWAHRVQEIFADYDRGLINTKELQEYMGKSFSKLLEEARRLGTEGSKGMLDLIRDMRNRGVEIAEITEYINEQLQSGAEAISNYWKSAVNSQNDFVRAEQYTLSLFNAFIAEGKSVMEAMELVGSGLDEALKLMTEQGYEATGSFKDLLKFQKKIADNKDLIDSIKYTTEVLNALGNTAYLTFDDFQTFSRDAASQFEKLINAGFSEKEALTALQPLLTQLLWYSEQYGFTLDDNIKKLIEKGKQEGMDFEKKKSYEETMIELQKRMVYALEKMAGIYRDDLTEAVEEWANVTEDKFKRIEERTKNLANTTKQLNNSYFNSDTIDTSGAKDGLQGFASGGEFWVDRPTPILVGEGGEPEFVSIIPKSKLQGGKNTNVELRQTVNVYIPAGSNKDEIANAVILALRNNTRGIVDEVRRRIN